MPLLDALNIGYIVELQSDVQCTVDDNGGYLLEWLQEVDIFTVHGENSELITPPHGYHSRVVKYLWNTLPKTPKGYSSLIVAPLGFNDLVLHAVPAVVDTDKSLQPFDLPMWIKKDYKGVIPKGTPLAQIIPFKRDNWTGNILSHSIHYEKILYFKKPGKIFANRIKINYTGEHGKVKKVTFTPWLDNSIKRNRQEVRDIIEYINKKVNQGDVSEEIGIISKSKKKKTFR